MIDARTGDPPGSVQVSITVQGDLPPDSWSYGRRLRTERGERDGVPATTVSGRLRDEDEILSVLSALYEMHLPILDVNVDERG